jgi:hypothetical protein
MHGATHIKKKHCRCSSFNDSLLFVSRQQTFEIMAFINNSLYDTDFISEIRKGQGTTQPSEV